MSGMRIHRVAPGENLTTIARSYYGDKCGKRHALVIYQHNRDVISNPNVIYAGQELVIPHLSLMHIGALYD